MSIDFYMFAGINGAGKSTLYSSTIDSKLKTSKRVNADEIAHNNNWDWHDQKSNFKAMRIEVKTIHSYIADKQSFNMETTLASSQKSYINILNEAKKQGFATHLLYVGLNSPELAKERVKARVEKGGHGIPDDIIEHRYPKSINNLTKLAPLFDTVEIHDNSKVFQTVYARDKNKILIQDKSIKWAQECIKLDTKKVKERLLKRAQIYKHQSRER
ncbi:zeta toxin family protein [Lactobacillus sp. ESL0681]|uniref:zeta toxin family protein n=1 Tax=Lactobacillus sp. ESL0681 TaxID=2983211 RepID=UPI0023F9AC3E|nr:zeta toxin family protein [Lactobacillus sp. ESL0681]WEV41287.1 zeta toxin family protein [Lactobacillus sp. ESL0681]